jgi:alkylglycerol monooxygenase
VHHAINAEYIDQNHGQIFIFWDKWFGTFQEELDAVPAVYGITRPAGTWNPIKINFQHLTLLISDAWRAENWKDKFTIWFKPTGWRPQNFDEKYPVNKITNVYNFEKYSTQNSLKLIYWSVAQVLITLVTVSFLFNNMGNIGIPNIFIYGLFIFLTIYSYTELMDKSDFSIYWESLRFLTAIGILLYFGDWFGLNSLFPIGNYIIITYLLLSLFMNFYFVFFEFKAKKGLLINSQN